MADIVKAKATYALQTGRRKDYLRVELFMEQEQVDRAKLTELAQRFGLEKQLERAEPEAQRLKGM